MVEWWQWLIPIGMILAAIAWVAFVVHDQGKDVVEITQNQNVNEKLTPLQVINHNRAKKGLEPLDSEQFYRLYYRSLAEQRKQHPIANFFYSILSPIPKKYLVDDAADTSKKNE